MREKCHQIERLKGKASILMWPEVAGGEMSHRRVCLIEQMPCSCTRTSNRQIETVPFSFVLLYFRIQMREKSPIKFNFHVVFPTASQWDHTKSFSPHFFQVTACGHYELHPGWQKGIVAQVNPGRSKSPVSTG